MSKAKKVWVVWKCEECGRTHKDEIRGVLKIKEGWGFYWEWECDKCHKVNRINMKLSYGFAWSR